MSQENFTLSVTKNKVQITFDASETLRPSKSGKTQIIATSGGAEPISTESGVIYLNLNAYKK